VDVSRRRRVNVDRKEIGPRVMTHWIYTLKDLVRVELCVEITSSFDLAGGGGELRAVWAIDGCKTPAALLTKEKYAALVKS